MKCSIAVKILGIVLLMSIALGCERSAAPEKPGAAADITAGVWQLAAIQRPGDAETAVAPAPPYTIQFGADGRFSGRVHCNHHTGQYELRSAGSIALTAGASTRMMCLGDSISINENEFLKTLGTITNYETSGGKLILSSNNGTKLVFTSNPDIS